MNTLWAKLKRKLNILGPGLTTGVSDDDPSGIATYSQAGSQFGFATLWTAIVTFPLMVSVLEMTARITLVTSKDIIGNIKEQYSKGILYFIIFLSFPAITFNIGADIAAMGNVSNLIFPAVPSIIFSTFFTLIFIIGLVRFSYRKVAKILKWICLSLIVYFLVPFSVKQDWEKVLLSTFVPSIEWNAKYLNIFVAILGTTISPYLFFWQSLTSLEHYNHKANPKKMENELKDMREDITWGMFFSNLAMFFIILTTGSVLYPQGIHDIQTVKDAAAALKPLVGEFAYLLFALGVIGTGALAIPVLGTCVGYIFAETFDLPKGMDKKWHEAKWFYGIIIGTLILGLMTNILGVNTIDMLIYTAVIYGITCPFLMGIIFLMGNNRKVMGIYKNSILSNVVGGIAIVLNAFAAVVFILFLFL